ncbi:NADH-quinone oxidoreductase subunit C [Sulfuracidifex metallicus]|uniref:NADH-quinone oxidoreductase subunit C n=1 Tax=Sulfuracidifex metallicus DSM 6482 = JCM 9184 TaxID=523847 RepID=A0A6A9QT89_SULME|nr:NADH-quinone oxidoreductase subunit C [Sulfuracidifex metallicus]MUN28362.1 NADH-quinone oxidoreductase subunit C [Sulfuracidifex metallicus DSM 6482 = JCM 9184]WOE51119.1 NADH-quinone oxidoreductase subunit C [Sulfuracidifex metallicus DSM 6482 = JCM 9184]
MTTLSELIKEFQSLKLQAKLESPNRATLVVDKDKLREIASLLKSKGFDHVISVTGMDYQEQSKLEVVYHFSSYTVEELKDAIVALRSSTSYEDPNFPSLYSIFESVWTGERETFETLGIYFRDHPDMRRMFLPEDFEGVYPLRKSFKIKLEGVFIDKPV